MNSLIQNILSAILLAMAIYYLISRIVKTTKNKGHCSGQCGCSKDKKFK